MPFSTSNNNSEKRCGTEEEEEKSMSIATNNWWNLRQFEIALQCIGKHSDWFAGQSYGAGAAADDDDNDCTFGGGWYAMTK